MSEMPTGVAGKLASHFDFLVQDHGFELRDASVAHEIAVVYSRGSLSVRVILEIPAAPIVELQQLRPGRAPAWIQLAPGPGSCGGALDVWNRSRDEWAIDRLVDALRAGGLDDRLHPMLDSLAQGVVERWQRFLDGTLFRDGWRVEEVG